MPSFGRVQVSPGTAFAGGALGSDVAVGVGLGVGVLVTPGVGDGVAVLAAEDRITGCEVMLMVASWTKPIVSVLTVAVDASLLLSLPLPTDHNNKPMAMNGTSNTTLLQRGRCFNLV